MTRDFLKPKFIEREVNGTPLKFYSLPVSILFKIRDVATPVIKALVTVFKDTGEDAGRILQNYDNPRDGESGNRTEIMPISVDVARFRDVAIKESLTSLIEGLSNDTTRLLLGEVIMSSLRDTFERPKKGFSVEDIRTFMDDPNFDVETMTSLLTGTLEASKGMLGPLGQSVIEMFQVIKVKAAALVAQQVAPKAETAPTNG